MPKNKLLQLLDTNGIKYLVLTHSPAYTAQEIAMLAHIPGQEMAKTVILKIDGKMTMAALPASHMVDFRRLRELTGATTVELANEVEFKDRFPECEVGAMPPFGNLYKMDVLVEGSLAEDEEIAFNAGSHRELVKMAYKDLDNLVHPKIMKFSIKRREHGEEEGKEFFPV
jgi:Ala-tRNA(Pro) deacylase